MLLKQVDPVSPQPAEAGLDRGHDAGCAPLFRVLLVVVQELAGDHCLVTSGTQRHADELLRVALAQEGGDAVFLGGVDQVDAGVESGVDDAGDLSLVTSLAEEVGPEVVAADADD